MSHSHTSYNFHGYLGNSWQPLGRKCSLPKKKDDGLTFMDLVVTLPPSLCAPYGSIICFLKTGLGEGYADAKVKVAYLSTVIPNSGNTLWWALALGVCFRGNDTIIGASTKVVSLGTAETRGYRMTFGGLLKAAFPFMMISVLTGHIWLLIFRPE